MHIPEPHTLYKCTQCDIAVYEVTKVVDGIVYYRDYHNDDGYTVHKKSYQVFSLEFKKLDDDDAISVVLTKTGGIF
jgi:hypothetical protein